MINIKLDLINKIITDKYYAETELNRLYNDESIEYREKLNRICSTLDEIIMANTRIEEVNKYFVDDNDESLLLDPKKEK